ncbi:MAG TPA: hypothetical protein VN028_02570 [Rhodocyclaceae bacterium]|nr:hypothetical protein [Rhodocyclaceae bacterium]
MDVGGLARAFLLKDQLQVKPCSRCGLHYDQREPKCPHCGDLDAEGLDALLAEQEGARAGNARMGRIFLLIALVLGVIVLLGVLNL